MQRKTPRNVDNEKEPNKVRSKKSISAKSSSYVGLICRMFLILMVLVFATLSYFVGTRFGIGALFPIQELNDMPPIVKESELQIIAELDTPPGNLAVSSKGRIFFNFHPEYKPTPTKVAELKNRTSWLPFPSLEFQSKIVTCLSMRIDSKDRLWLLDFAQHGTSGSPKLFSFQLAQTPTQPDHSFLDYEFPPSVAGFGSMLNDFVVDPTGQFIYIADTSLIAATPALVVFSIKERRSHRILSSHESMFGGPFLFNVGGVPTHLGPLAFKVRAHVIFLSF
jgi:hypothetical protein